MSTLRKSVLQGFKQLHKTSKKVFQGDVKTIIAARLKINEEYSKNKNVTNEETIKTLIKYGEDVEKELRTSVIQAREVKPGVFEARITEDTLKLDNIPYNDSAIPDEGMPGSTPCCQADKKKY